VSSNEAEPLRELPRTADLLALYARPIAGCQRRDARVVNAVLLELIDSLNFEYETAALGFFRVYDHCLRKVRQREFGAAQEAFENLHDAVEPVLAASTSSEA
jgi:hypothetical protein